MPGVDGCLGRGVAVVCSGCGALAVRMEAVLIQMSFVVAVLVVAGCVVSGSVARLVVDTGRSGGGCSN